MQEVAALFVRRDSIYKTMPGVNAWDADRNARLWPGGCPVIAHPPCRQWGRLRQFAHGDDYEKSHGPWAANQVRRWGGYWSTRRNQHCGALPVCPLPDRGTSSAAGHCQSINTRLGTGQRKRRGYISVASSHGTFQIFRWYWGAQHIVSARQKVIHGYRRSRKQSENIHRRIWLSGW